MNRRPWWNGHRDAIWSMWIGFVVTVILYLYANIG